NLGGTHMCDSCGMVEPTYNMVLSFILEDESSNIRVIAFREIAEKLISLDAEEAMNLIGETQDEAAPLEHAREKLLKKEITVTGNTRYNDYNDTLEVIANQIDQTG
ncbi:MAG: hypothetical protein GF334_11440, partial [Candidatus Altiarchaeales archaeon]|nr:hypothetical protein [Candidatus Altiarchaeales archaeon]